MYSPSRFRCVYHHGRVESLEFAESVFADLHVDTCGIKRKGNPSCESLSLTDETHKPRGQPGL